MNKILPIVSASCFLLVTSLAINLGCERSEYVDSNASDFSEKMPSISRAQSSAGTDSYIHSNGIQAGSGGKTTEEADQGTSVANRKIIYRANVSVKVEDFSNVGSKIARAVADHNGFIANQKSNLSSHRHPSGSWVVRVPTDRFQSFMNAAKSIGVLTQLSIDSDDITEQFFDVQARLKNQRKLEERVLKLLQRPGDDLKHIITVEKELARIREVIEQFEGRLRLMADQSDLATVTIRVDEEKNYVPPSSLSFTEQISKNWNQSVAAMQRFLENIVLRIVLSGPTLILLLALSPLAWILFRMLKRRFL